MSFRYILRLIGAFLVRFRLVILVGIIIGIAVFFIFRLFGNSIFENKVENIGISGRYTASNIPPDILNLIGQGLTKMDDKDLPAPALAASWETPDGGKTWIFHLKDNVYWQDGKKVDSESINYQFSDAKVEKPDTKTVVFKLENPYSPFPTIVSQPVFKKGFLGTGDWKVTKVTMNGDYVQQMAITNKKGEKKVFKFYPTEDRAKLAYELGQVNTLINIFNPQPFDTWKNSQIVYDYDLNSFVAVFFNTQDSFLSDKSVRQALTYAINKDSFNDSRAISPIPPTSWAYNSQVKPYSYDPERAKELLKDLPADSSKNVQLTVIPILLPLAEKISADWNAIGIKTTVKVSATVPSDYQALLAIFQSPKDPDQYSIWHSTQTGTNISHYRNPRIDKLLEDGRTVVDFEQRKAIYLDFQRFLIEDCPAAFLYHPNFYTITNK